MPKNKNSKSFEIALSAVSCAVAVLFLLFGVFSRYLLATGYLVAQIALMLPLAKQFPWGDFLAYLGTVILALILGAVASFWEVVPFIMFFGLHPLANYFQVKFRVNKWIAFVIKMVWFDITLYVMYLLMWNITGITEMGSQTIINVVEFVEKYIWLFIIVLGSLFLWLYDYLMFRMQIWVNKLVYRIRK